MIRVLEKTNNMEQLLRWSIENSDPSGGSPQPPPQDDPEKKKIVSLIYLESVLLLK